MARVAQEQTRTRPGCRSGCTGPASALRKSGVDYFRGDGSDWIALAGLLLDHPGHHLRHRC